MQPTQEARNVRSGFSSYTKTVDIPYKGANVSGRMECLPCGIRIQLTADEIEDVPIAPGMVWVPNREAARLTNGATGYMLCDDAYKALRLCLHASNGYGIGTPDPTSESAVLHRSIREARALSNASLRRRLLPPAARSANDDRLAGLGADFVAKRSETKRDAGTRFLEAGRTIRSDRLGRPNAPAAAMKIGKGIGDLLQRLYDVAQINEVITSRATVLGRFIETKMLAFDALWADLQGEPHFERGGYVFRLCYLVREGSLPNATSYALRRGENAKADLVRTFLKHRQTMSGIRALPFRKNAFHAMHDLDTAVSLVRAGSVDALTRHLETLRQGLRWIYALNYLQLVILTPLSLFLARAERDETYAHPSMALVPSLRVFESKLAKCSDKNLKTPVKERVVSHLIAAISAADSGGLHAAKESLEEIAKIL